MRGEPKLVPAGRDSADHCGLVYGSSSETLAGEEQAPPRPRQQGEDASERTPLLDNGKKPSSLEEGRFVMTHEVASPAVPNKMEYRTPNNRLATPILTARGTVARPDHGECLKRAALVVHKHVTVCEQREQRVRSRRAREEYHPAAEKRSSAFFSAAGTSAQSSSRRERPASVDGGFGFRTANSTSVAAHTQESQQKFRSAASRVFEEAAYLRPRYEVVFAKTPHSWIGFQFAVEKARRKYRHPTTTDVYDFLVTLFTRAHLSSECSIVCLIYVERLMDKGKVSLLRNNWRPILLCSMLLASKVWQDCASWNIEFSVIYPQFTLAAINLLERHFVAALGWDMYISQSLYAKYYYGLRALNEHNDFRRRYNMFVQRTTNERPKDALNVQQRSDKLSDVLANVYSRSF